MRILLILVLAAALSSCVVLRDCGPVPTGSAGFSPSEASIETLPRKETRASYCSKYLREYSPADWNEATQRYPYNAAWHECMGVDKK